MDLILKRQENVPDSEFDPRFVQGMIARMEMSFIKYGPVAAGFPHKLDALATLGMKLDEYRATGNTEKLMDAANYLLIEFMRPRHPDAHFKPTDSRDTNGRAWHDGAKNQNDNRGHDQNMKAQDAPSAETVRRWTGEAPTRNAQGRIIPDGD